MPRESGSGGDGISAGPGDPRSGPLAAWLAAGGRRDAATAAAVLGLELLAFVVLGGPAARYARPGWLAVTAVGVAPLLGRRRWPLQVCAALIVLTGIEGAAGWPLLAGPGLLVATATVAACCGWRSTLLVVTGVVSALVIGPALRTAASTGGLVTRIAVALTTVAGGLAIASSRRWRAEERLRAVAVQREEGLRAQAAVTGERLRIARELHDVVAHQLSLVVLQAAAARTSLDETEPAALSVEAIERASRTALEEMRRVVGVLRLPDTGVRAELSPQPTAADLQALVEESRAAGLAIDLRVSGDVAGLSDGVGLVLYRIAQEALTNVIQHAQATKVYITLDRGPGQVTLTVADNGRAAPGLHPPTVGHGLIGMRERVAMFGGRLSAGRAPGGGWVVRADIPLSDRTS